MTTLLRSLFPVSLIAVICSLGCSGSDSEAKFRLSLPDYERIVQLMESGSIHVPAPFGEVQLSAQDAHLAQNVFAGRDTNGVLTVMFFTRSGFPALHSGYMYRSSGEAGPDFAARWPGLEKVTNKWFYISN
jgi:hypothetical protein